ncbi:MAG: metallophosphoesterase [Kiritimatiellae bacterium]|nr:metallophosphoesterase [Kiritimatiellia bacterium]
MTITRHDFLRGLLTSLGVGAFGRPIFAAPPGWSPPGRPNLIFGAVSDTHLRTANRGDALGANWPDKYFVAALSYFREQNVDAVVHCGDFAHRGQVREMVFHANAWFKVFPKNRAPDGHPVVKLFVTGNHDVEGAQYGDFVKTRYPDPVERAKRILQTDMAGNWQRIWGESYEPVWHTEVKGYHFFGHHYGLDELAMVPLLKKQVEAYGLAKGDRPFFILSHRRPYAPLRKAVTPFRNAFAFFGHNHCSAANWNVVDLYYGVLPCIQCPSCEPRGSGALTGDAYIAKAPLGGKEAVGRPRPGYLVRMYDDMMVISRREFGEGGSLGSDWIMPLGVRTPHPLSRAELKNRIGTPQFRAGSVLGTEETVLVLAKEKRPRAVLRIKIPLADANPDSRVYAYDVEVSGGKAGAKPLCRSVYACGCNMGIGHEPDHGVTTLAIPKSELPAGDALTITVTPLSSLGTRGRPLQTVWRV